MTRSLLKRSVVDASALKLYPQLKFLDDALECTVNKTAPARNKTQRRVRSPELSFPDLQDTQLSFVPYPAANAETWTDEEIAKLHEGLLIQELRSLADQRASPEMRRRVIEWVARPLVPPSQLAQSPLSFQAACCFCGLDAMRTQEALLRRFAPERLNTLDENS